MLQDKDATCAGYMRQTWHCGWLHAQMCFTLQARQRFFATPFWQDGAQLYTEAVCGRVAKVITSKLDSVMGIRRMPAPLMRMPSTHAPLKPALYICNKSLTQSQSQEGQDMVVVHDFFKDVCGGLFLEVGGADGKSNSNTYVSTQLPHTFPTHSHHLWFVATVPQLTVHC